MKAPLLTEVLPSSGEEKCKHQFVVAEGHVIQDGVKMLVLVCSKCGQSMISRPIVVKESKNEKPLLME